MEKNPTMFTERQMDHIKFSTEIATMRRDRDRERKPVSRGRGFRNFGQQGNRSNQQFPRAYRFGNQQFNMRNPPRHDTSESAHQGLDNK